jgi:uncharacterized membrane protein
MLDLRLPSGLFFAIVGLTLVALGLFSPELRAPMTTVDVNLWAGLAMLGFGAFLLILARRKSQKSREKSGPE